MKYILKHIRLVAIIILVLLNGGLVMANNKTVPENTITKLPDVPQLSPTPSGLPTPTVSKGKTTPTNKAKSATPTPTTTQAIGGTNNESNSNTNITNPTNTPSPTTNPGVILSTNNVSITMNKGENRSNVFSFTSSGVTQFTLYGYPTTYGAGINWNPSSGGIANGQTVNVSMNVTSNIPTGTYTGQGKLIFNPGNIEKFVQFNITVQEAPPSALGFTFSNDSVSITISKGTSQSVFSFTSTGSNSFLFSGYPTSYGPGINWSVQTGYLGNGQSETQQISVSSSVQNGTYTGNGLFRDENSGAEKSIPVTVTVTN